MKGPKKFTVKTANGETEIIPCYCEWTGKRIGWRTVFCNSELDITPAFLSHDVVSKSGKVKIDLSNCQTF